MSTQLVVAFTATSLAGTLMYFHGVSWNLIDRRPVRCRNCGAIPGRTCTCDRCD